MYSGKTREDWERLEQATFLYNRAQWMAFSYITCYAWTYILTGMNERMNQRPIFSGWRVKSSSWLIVTYNSLTSFQSGYPHGIINFHVNDVVGRNRNKKDDPVLAGNYMSLPKRSWRVVQSGLGPIQIDSCSVTNSFNFLVLISLGHEPTLLLFGWSVAITRSPYGVSLISSSFIKWDLSLYTGN